MARLCFQPVPFRIDDCVCRPALSIILERIKGYRIWATHTTARRNCTLYGHMLIWQLVECCSYNSNLDQEGAVGMSLTWWRYSRSTHGQNVWKRCFEASIPSIGRGSLNQQLLLWRHREEFEGIASRIYKGNTRCIDVWDSNIGTTTENGTRTILLNIQFRFNFSTELRRRVNYISG